MIHTDAWKQTLNKIINYTNEYIVTTIKITWVDY